MNTALSLSIESYSFSLKLYLNDMFSTLRHIIFLNVLLWWLPHGTMSQTRGALPASHHRVIVIAHRGDHTEVPENTLAAYQKAIEDGADFVETCHYA